MPIKIYNPTSAGRRNSSVVDYRAVLTKSKPERSLTVGKRRAHGRNHHGVITAKHRGGGNKKLYRLIDFKRQKDGVQGRSAPDGIDARYFHATASRLERPELHVVRESLSDSEGNGRGLVLPVQQRGQRRRSDERADQGRDHVAAVEGGAIRRPRVAQAKR